MATLRSSHRPVFANLLALAVWKAGSVLARPAASPSA
jgi:hypothetical protein